MPTTLVSTDQLAAHPAGDWVIVDCRFDLANTEWGNEQYLRGHIPGAVYAHLDRDLSGARTGQNGRHPLPEPDALCEAFGRWGIEAGRQVVAYDQDTGLYASRLWWLLRYLGHDASAVLDGGLAQWQREARPMQTGRVSTSRRRFAGSVRPELLVDAAEVERRLGDASAPLVDARARERYEGRVEPLDPVAGHVPGAANHFFLRNLDAAGLFLPPDALRDAWRATLGAAEPAGVISYCGSGVTACHNLLALEHAGLGGGRLYAGSWSEWCSDPRRPVEREPATR